MRQNHAGEGRGDRRSRRIRVGSKVLFDARCAAKADYGDAMWYTADDCIQHRAKMTVVVEVQRTEATSLHDYH